MRAAFVLVLLALPLVACTQIVQRERPVPDAAPEAVTFEQDAGQDAGEEAALSSEAGDDADAPEAEAAAPGHVVCAVGALTYACPCVECQIAYMVGGSNEWCSTHPAISNCDHGSACSVYVNGGAVSGTCQ